MSATNGRPLSTFLTTAEAAEYLRVSVPTMERMRLTEGPPFIKLGNGKRGRVLYSREDLDAYVAGRRRTNTSDRGGAADR